jgi:hypothetical protein
LIKCVGKIDRFGEFARSNERPSSAPIRGASKLRCATKPKKHVIFTRNGEYMPRYCRGKCRYECKYGGRKRGNVNRASGETKGSRWRMLTKD